jgi:hypothetical protein
MNIFSLEKNLSARLESPLIKKRLIIESTSSRPNLHALLIYGHLLVNSLQMFPIFIAAGETRRLIEEHAPRYLGQFEIISPCKIARARRGYLLLISLGIWLKVAVGQSLVNMTWRGLQIGDIIYDQYLAGRQHAKLHRNDPHLLRYIYITLRGIEEGEQMLRLTRADAVLLSHRVGIWAAPFANAAQLCQLASYSFGGDKYGTLIKASIRKAYEYKVTPQNLAPILSLSDGQLNRLFNSVQTELLEGAFNADAKLAFSKKLYENREDFSRSYNLPNGKRNVFIMLHAFTDYPHSHFNGMLFDDFYDWFIQTLDHAFGNTSVNWIIKSHPASHFYPVRDMNWDLIKDKYRAKHIAFMSEDADFDTRSVMHVGDAVVTCIGSAGFELSALAGIPSITAGDNPYAHGGFAIYPANRKEYFQVLSKISEMQRLEGERLRRAKATFVFIHRLSRVRMSSIPALSHEEHRYYQDNDEYFSRVVDAVKGKERIILKEIESYKNAIASVSFEALRTSPTEYLYSLDER